MLNLVQAFWLRCEKKLTESTVLFTLTAATVCRQRDIPAFVRSQGPVASRSDRRAHLPDRLLLFAVDEASISPDTKAFLPRWPIYDRSQTPQASLRIPLLRICRTLRHVVAKEEHIFNVAARTINTKQVAVYSAMGSKHFCT